MGKRGCTIYSKRPMICRLFGTVNREQAEELGIFKAYCPRGGAPEIPLSLARAIKIQSDYEGLLWTEACKLIQQFIAYLKGPRVVKLPLKFEYLRYLFSTQDGQRGMALLMGIDPGTMQPEQLNKLQQLMEVEQCQLTL